MGNLKGGGGSHYQYTSNPGDINDRRTFREEGGQKDRGSEMSSEIKTTHGTLLKKKSSNPSRFSSFVFQEFVSRSSSCFCFV